MIFFINLAQSVCNYVLLTIIYAPIWIYFTNNKYEIIECLRKNWWKYFLIALADVEANYFMIKAYSQTIVTTIQVNLL
jgi:solute carrier family 35, member F1/2